MSPFFETKSQKILGKANRGIVTGKKIAMLQPNYIPWKGVFDLISRVDVFVFYDDVQFTKKDWRNRNIIKTANGPVWLTVPVLTSGRRRQLIHETRIDSQTAWQNKHIRSIWNSYRRAPFFSNYENLLEEIYIDRKWEYLSHLDIFSTKLLATALGIEVEWHLASELGLGGRKDGDKVIQIATALGANHFINGPASRDFMNKSLFEQAEIQLEFMSYEYREYPQLHGDFLHQVSVLDLLFNCGPDSYKMIRGNYRC